MKPDPDHPIVRKFKTAYLAVKGPPVPALLFDIEDDIGTDTMTVSVTLQAFPHAPMILTITKQGTVTQREWEKQIHAAFVRALKPDKAPARSKRRKS